MKEKSSNMGADNISNSGLTNHVVRCEIKSWEAEKSSYIFGTALGKEA